MNTKYQILNTKYLPQFLLTVTIPSIYALVLITTYLTPETFPDLLGPTMSFLSRTQLRLTNLIIALIGILLWIWSYYHLRHHFGVLPNSKTKVTSGPYALFNHPMYWAIFLTFTGLALTVLSTPGLFINLFLLTPINILRANRESAKFTA